MDLEREIELMMPNLRAYIGMLDNACSAIIREASYLEKIAKEKNKMSKKDVEALKKALNELDKIFVIDATASMMVKSRQESIMCCISDFENKKNYN